MRCILVVLLFVFSQLANAQELSGFSDLYDVLLETKPSQHNKTEWTKIRDDLISSSHKSDYERLYDLVISMREIRPRRDNIPYWANIRRTCTEIVADWDDYSDKSVYYRKLLYRFKDTTPAKHNSKEWENIRRVADQILRSVDTR